MAPRSKRAETGQAPSTEGESADDRAKRRTVQFLSKEPAALTSIDRQHALDMLNTLRTRRTFRERRDREEGVAPPMSLFREREAKEVAEKIAYLCDRYSELTSSEEAAALFAFMTAIAQQVAGTRPRGRKPQPFPNEDQFLVGAAYDQAKRDTPGATHGNLIRALVQLVKDGAFTLPGTLSAKAADDATIEKRVRRAISLYQNRRKAL